MQTIASQTLNTAPPHHHPLQRQNEAAGQGGEWLSVPTACVNPYSPSKLFFVRLAFCRRPEWLAVDVLWRRSWKSCEKSRGNSDEELPGDSYHAPAFDPPATYHWPHGHRDSPAGRRQCPALPCCPDEATGPIEAPFARIAAEKSAVSTRCITL